MSADTKPQPTRLAIVAKQREKALARVVWLAEMFPRGGTDGAMAVAEAAHWCTIYDSLVAEAGRATATALATFPALRFATDTGSHDPYSRTAVKGGEPS